jgi:hypothetical protein
MGNEVALPVVEVSPVLEVLTKVYFFSCPERSFLLFIELPDVIVFNGKKNKAVLVLLKDRFLLHDVFQLLFKVFRLLKITTNSVLGSKIHSSSGDYKSALQISQEIAEIRDSVLYRETYANVTELYSNFDRRQAQELEKRKRSRRDIQGLFASFSSWY